MSTSVEIDLRHRINDAASIALEAIHDGGVHHKQWVIDQMVCALLGDAYDAWRPEGWDVGIDDPR